MFDRLQLRTLATLLRAGSFDAAARLLGVTQSAVSQRVRALEERAGTVLVRRTQPVAATAAGARLARHAEALDLIEAGVRADLGLGTALCPTLRIAVNADSLATWFLPALASVEGFLFDLVIDDQDHSHDLLLSGEVVAAVTGQAGPVQGCDSVPLGALRYLATASAGFRDRWFRDGVSAATLADAPSLTFNAKDTLQDRWVRRVTGAALQRPTHLIPSSQAFVEAACLGLGWGMNPEPLVRDHLAAGRLVALRPDLPLDVPLYWQQGRLTAAPLAGLAVAVRAAARAMLVPPG